ASRSGLRLLTLEVLEKLAELVRDGLGDHLIEHGFELASNVLVHRKFGVGRLLRADRLVRLRLRGAPLGHAGPLQHAANVYILTGTGQASRVPAGPCDYGRGRRTVE